MEAFVLRLERSSNERNAPSPHKPPSASARSSSPSLGALGSAPVSRFAQPRAALPPLRVLPWGLQQFAKLQSECCCADGPRAGQFSAPNSHGSTSAGS